VRTLSATVTSAIAQTTTQPKYLVMLGFTSGTVYAATWDTDVAWGIGLSPEPTWLSSGIEVSNLNTNGAQLVMPNGDADPWLSLVLNDGTRNAAVSIYQHVYNVAASPQADAVLVFTGIMDEANIEDERILVSVIAQSQAKRFPPGLIDAPTFNYLPTAGTTITWGADKIVVN